jgi:hypothetical protein
MVHTCNPSTGRLRQEDQELEPNLGYIRRLCLKKPRAGLKKQW